MLHRNLSLKAAAFALAIFLWFWVLLNERHPIVERTVRVPITPHGLSSDLALQGPLPQAELRVRGLRRDIDQLADRVSASISVARLSAGRHQLPVQPHAPDRATVTRVRPDEVSIVLEPLTTEMRRVELRLFGEPPAGYEVTNADASPLVVKVSGARSQVERTARVLASLDLRRAAPDVPVAVPVRPVDASGEPVEGPEISPERVNVRVSMKPVVASATVPIVLDTQGSLPPGLRLQSVQLDPPMVTIVGPSSVISEVRAVSTTRLPLDQVQNSLSRELRLVAPEGVTLLSASAVRVTVRIERLPPAEEAGD